MKVRCVTLVLMVAIILEIKDILSRFLEYFLKLKLQRSTKYVIRRLSKKSKEYLHRLTSHREGPSIWTYPILNIRFSKTVSKFFDNDRMSYETERYKTFDTCSNESIGKKDLAANGFYYFGLKDQVICFSCKKEYGNWKENDNPSNVHARISPSCPFLKGQSSNIPIKEEKTDEAKDVGTNVRRANSGAMHRERRKENIQVNVDPNLNMNESSAWKQRSSDVDENYACGLAVPPRTKNFPTRMHGQQAKNSEKCMRETTSNHPKLPKTSVNNPTETNEKFNTLENRLKTFSKWPKSSIIKPKELARAGFYYGGILFYFIERCKIPFRLFKYHAT